MRLKAFITTFLILFAVGISAQTIIGTVKNREGVALPFSSIEVKGRNNGTVANAEGTFQLTLPKGKYTISCQHVGYERLEISIEIVQEQNTLEFILKPASLTLGEVVIKKGEDPAAGIIRNAIKKRTLHKKELQQFSTEVYTKGQMRLRDYPTKLMGKKVDFEDGDTSKKKFLFLSETVSKYAVAPPNKSKIEVIASKVSGESNAYGLSAPKMISFYENFVAVGENLNAHGFVSPIADNALHYYRYKYEGAYFEEGRLINRIKVIPRRKFEPLFTGFINIIEDEWRIHSLQLQLTKEYRMEFIDTLRLEQLYIPASAGKWVLKSQVVYPSIKLFGFDLYGSFVNVYSSYDLNPSFSKSFFDKVVLKYADSAINKPGDYWATNRPIVLQQEEAADYQKKDSLEIVRKSPHYQDSLDRIRNKTSIPELLISGYSITDAKSRSNLSFSPLLETISYNTVEGLVANISASYHKRLDSSIRSRKSITITPEIRYGFSNRHLNGNLTAQYSFGKRHGSTIYLSGGSDVFQFNNAAPVDVIGNTFTTLISGRNNLKIYKAGFASFQYSKNIGSGLNLQFNIDYQDRKPLENTSSITIKDANATHLTPNRPLPLTDANISRHQATITNIAINWQPGVRYIEYPNQTVSIPSNMPRFRLSYTKAIDGLFGSDVDYSKWLFRITDGINLGLKGAFEYRLDFGGFIDSKNVEVPDLIHFRGNTSRLLTKDYLTRFQLIPHYYFSHQQSFYSLLFAEHHFNGFITNKIPGLKHWKWNLVGGANALYLKSGKYYTEPFIGLENIFKLIRVDYLWGIEKNQPNRNGFRVGIKTTFGNNR